MSRLLQAIVIGGSAGSVDVLSSLLPALRADVGAPVLVVVHLPRERPSRLPEIFAPRCHVAVCEAEDKQPLEPNTVYFAPPDYHLLVDEGPAISLSSDEPVYFSRPSIDVLLESAADVFGPGLLGIVLSGANQDGAAGLSAISARGGVTVVQDPETATASTMPEAALRGAPRSLCLPVKRIADLLHGVSSAALPDLDAFDQSAP